MKRRTKNTWLFAFTDLSFLLLISLSMIPGAPQDISLHLAEMHLPVVPDSRSLQPLAERQQSWELQILPVTGERPSPFRLVRAGERDGTPLDEQSLIPALQELKKQQVQPALLPDKTSLSQDFLFAAAALAQVWSLPDSRTIVKPMPRGVTE